MKSIFWRDLCNGLFYQRRQGGSGRTVETVVDITGQGCWLQVDFYQDSAVLLGMMGQGGGRMDKGGGADGEEEVAMLGGADGLGKGFWG